MNFPIKKKKRAFRLVHKKPNLSLDKLVALDMGITIHNKNIINLLPKVYKTTRGENPIHMNKIFTLPPSQKQKEGLQPTYN